MEKCVDGGHFRRADLPGGADQHKLSGSDRHEEKTAALWTMLGLILLSVILTGANVFQKLARVFGAGVLVPITGFANSVASPALEYKAEGQVFGVGCKIFTIAGPVILYGILSSWGLGVVYWGWMMLTQ